MNRQALAVALAVLAVVGATAPVVALPSERSPAVMDGLAPDVREHTSLFGFDRTDVVTYGADSRPGFIVYTTDGDLSTLRTWANASDDRELIATDNATNYALVAAPPAAIGVSRFDRLLNNGLASEEWVRAVTLNRRAEYVDPVDQLVNQSDYRGPGRWLSLNARLREPPGAYDKTAPGIAFDGDADPTTLEEARAVAGADNVSVNTSGITVAVIDTGVNTQDGQVFGNGTDGSSLRIDNASKNVITNESVDVPAGDLDAVGDGNGHGTHVAATILANTSNDSYDGYAPDATLLALKALADDGSGSTADIAAAVRYAADNDADVISMSLGAPTYSLALDNAIQYALDNGVTAVVVAAGNSRQTTRWVASPADSERVISVAAANGSEPPTAAVGYFSQLGDDPGTTDLSEGATAGATVDVTAPGMKIVAPVPTEAGGRQNRSLTGTSMATPQVAGAVTVALAEDGTLANRTGHVNALVDSTARRMPHAATREAGAGMVAVDRLVNRNNATQSQAEAMTGVADARDAYWRGLSESSGGLITRFLT